MTAQTDNWSAIEQVLHTYAWMVDQRKWELIDAVFTADATIDYTSTGGKKGACRPALAWLDRALAGSRIRERICNQTIMIGQLPPGYVIPE